VFGFAAVELEYAGGYAGWVMAYDKSTLTQSGVFATVDERQSGAAACGSSGRPPVVDKLGVRLPYSSAIAYGKRL